MDINGDPTLFEWFISLFIMKNPMNVMEIHENP